VLVSRAKNDTFWQMRREHFLCSSRESDRTTMKMYKRIESPLWLAGLDDAVA